MSEVGIAGIAVVAAPEPPSPRPPEAAMNPLLDRPILLLDEPTSALDPDSRQAVYDCLAGLERQTLLMVSHDAGPALHFADRTVRLPGEEAARGA